MKTIVIDPGHGGQDPGVVFNGYKEKEFTLLIGMAVKNYLEKYFQAKPVMTRDSDVTMALKERSFCANRLNADFFCSIHLNAGGGTGFESFIYNGAVSAFTKESQAVIHNQAVKVLHGKYGVKDHGKRAADFHVLRETKMPAILVEVLFLDHEKDLMLLLNKRFIMDISCAIGEGMAKALSLPLKKHSKTFTL